MLGCTPQAYKACACPASRLKKEPRINNRDCWWFNGWGSLHIWSKGLERHPTLCHEQWVEHGTVFPPRDEEGGEGTSYSGIDIRWAHQLPGKPAERHARLIRTITTWGPGQVNGKVSQISLDKTSTGQAGNIQRARQQPSGVFWPYLHPDISCTTLSILVCPSLAISLRSGTYRGLQPNTTDTIQTGHHWFSH